MHTLYLGPSWAVQSFETVTGDDVVKTNLAQELELTDYTSLALYACSNGDQIVLAQKFMSQHPELAPFRVVFVTANSLQDGHKTHGMSQVEFARHFLISNDPLNIVKSLEQDFYQQLLALNIPVALIGAHTDVTCESHNNITVIHTSWQNFLADLCGIDSFYGWPADVGHRWLQGIVIPESGPPESFELPGRISEAVVEAIHQMLKVNWSTLEHNKLWAGVHPNIKSNQLFAQQIKPLVNDWLDNHR